MAVIVCLRAARRQWGPSLCCAWDFLGRVSAEEKGLHSAGGGPSKPDTIIASSRFYFGPVRLTPLCCRDQRDVTVKLSTVRFAEPPDRHVFTSRSKNRGTGEIRAGPRMERGWMLALAPSNQSSVTR